MVRGIQFVHQYQDGNGCKPVAEPCPFPKCKVCGGYVEDGGISSKFATAVYNCQHCHGIGRTGIPLYLKPYEPTKRWRDGWEVVATKLRTMYRDTTPGSESRLVLINAMYMSGVECPKQHEIPPEPGESGLLWCGSYIPESVRTEPSDDDQFSFDFDEEDDYGD